MRYLALLWFVTGWHSAFAAVYATERRADCWIFVVVAALWLIVAAWTTHNFTSRKGGSA